MNEIRKLIERFFPLRRRLELLIFTEFLNGVLTIPFDYRGWL